MMIWLTERVCSVPSVTVRSWSPRVALEFEVLTWNLTEETWDQIGKGDGVQIELGWADGEIETVCLGEITSAKPEDDGGEVQYRIKGVDESEGVTYARPSSDWGRKSWLNASPDEIAADIASEIGLSAQVEPIDQNISGVWSVDSDQKVRAWLDDLLEYAAEFTGQAWEWFADRGQLHFQPRNQETVEAPMLSYDASLISLSPASSEDEDLDKELDFETMLEPKIRKGAAVYVDVDAHRGPYRVDEFEFNSSTVSGDHLVRGKLIPIEGDYSVA